MKHSFVRRVTARAVTLGAVTALAVGAHGAGVAGATPGVATIANPQSGAALASGGSDTTFTVTLPSGASCPGDTANGGYHVYSYLVHEGTDLSTVTFNNFPSAGYGFVDNTGTYYGPANTAINTGQIIGIPNNFKWGPLAVNVPLSELLYTSGTTGAWVAGLVCANAAGAATSSWATPITFTAAAGDPSGFGWSAVPGPPPEVPEVPLPILLPILGLAIVGGAYGINRRRQGRLSTVPLSSGSVSSN